MINTLDILPSLAAAKSYDVNIKKFSQVVRMAFNQRRKMLRNSLSTLNIDLDVCKVDFKRRPEQLTVSEFIDISNNII